MLQLIVLGLIPGTNIQMTFTLWLYVISVPVLLALLVASVRSRHVQEMSQQLLIRLISI